MLVMITKNKLLPFLYIILSSTGFAQSIDQSIISQLSEDQISLAISSLESENLTKDDPILEEDSDETLLANENQDDPNNSVDKKFGYDFFQNIPTSISAVEIDVISRPFSSLPGIRRLLEEINIQSVVVRFNLSLQRLYTIIVKNYFL